MGSIGEWKHFPPHGIDFGTGQAYRRALHPGKTIGWADCIDCIAQTLWSALLKRAVKEGRTEVTIECGDPNQESTQAYFDAAVDYLRFNNISYTPMYEAARGETRGRLYIRIPLT